MGVDLRRMRHAAMLQMSRMYVGDAADDDDDNNNNNNNRIMMTI